MKVYKLITVLALFASFSTIANASVLACGKKDKKGYKVIFSENYSTVLLQDPSNGFHDLYCNFFSSRTKYTCEERNKRDYFSTEINLLSGKKITIYMNSFKKTKVAELSCE